jgi:ABC-type multidrug transport system ATPase subunit
MERSTHLKDKNIEWDKELSLGEQQRLAFSRLFFHKPKFAILDESSSALDSINEDIVYSNCKKLGITLISVAHRKSLKKFHKNLLTVGLNKSYSFREILEKEKINKTYFWKKKKENIQKNDQLKGIEEDFVMIYKEDVSEKDNLKIDNKTGFNIKFIIRLLKIIYFIYVKNFNFFIWLNLIFIIIVAIVCGTLTMFIFFIFNFIFFNNYNL